MALALGAGRVATVPRARRPARISGSRPSARQSARLRAAQLQEVPSSMESSFAESSLAETSTEESEGGSALADRLLDAGAFGVAQHGGLRRAAGAASMHRTLATLLRRRCQRCRSAGRSAPAS